MSREVAARKAEAALLFAVRNSLKAALRDFQPRGLSQSISSMPILRAEASFNSVSRDGILC